MLKNKLFVISFVVVASFFLSGCLIAKPADIRTESPDVTLSGTLIQAGNKFSLNTAGKPPVEVNSREVDLSSYEGKTVTVTGQYSGTTLFVSKIK